jgi:hypothetical protein
MGGPTPRIGCRPVGRGLARRRGVGGHHHGVLELEELVAVDEGGGVGGAAVVGAAPGHEVQLAGLPGGPSCQEGVQERFDGLGREGAGEELRLGTEALRLRRLGDRRLAGLLAGVAQLRPEPPGLRPGHGGQSGRGGVGADVVDQLLDQPGGIGLGSVEGAVDVHGRGSVGVVAGGDLQARGQRVGCGRRPPLPGLDDGGGEPVRPGEVHVGGDRGRGHGPEDERRHDAEVAGAGAAQRPEQVLVVVVVAGEDAAVGEDDLGPDEVVGGDAVLAPEDPEAAAQGQPPTPTGGQVPPAMVRSCACRAS